MTPAHHVAAVFETEVGLVFRAKTGPHAHGTTRGSDYVDLLETASSASDPLPACCDCGSWTLSRAEVCAEVRPGRRTWHLT